MRPSRPTTATTSTTQAPSQIHLQSRDDAITRVRDPEIRELLYAHSGNFTALQREISRLQGVISRLSTSTTTSTTTTSTPLREFNILAYGGLGDGIFDNWHPFRRVMAAIRANHGGRLIVPDGIYRIAYDPTDATRTQTTGAIDLSPWEEDGVWVPLENVEIYFESGAILLMDNLLPDGFNAQSHGVFAQCRWTDLAGVHTPSTWSGYAINYRNIKLTNVRVEWATRGSARGVGDAFHFAGTKSVDTAPYGLTLDKCTARNSPQVGAIFMGCQRSQVYLDVDSSWADGCHFNACFEGNTAEYVKQINGGDDAVAVVTYYPDALTLARGIDTETGPFSSPDQTTANNNGLIVKSVHKIGGNANAVRLLGANGVTVLSIYADADSSPSFGSALIAGSVKANGTTLAESGMACIKCAASNIIARNGVQVGLHIVSQGMDGSEGDSWLRQDVSVLGGHISDCVQASIWAHDCRGWTIKGVKTDSTKVDISNISDFTISLETEGDVNITGTATSYATSDMDTIPDGKGTIEYLKITGGKLLLTDFNTILTKHIEIHDSPGTAFEAIRVRNLIGPPIKVVNANRSAVVDLAHIPVRCIPGHDWNTSFDITHDSTPVLKFIEVGGGDAYNVSRDVRLTSVITHSVAGLADDPYEVQGSTYAPVNLFRRSYCRKSGSWKYVNTDDLPLGIVPEIEAAAVGGTRTLKIYDALAVFATGVLSGISTALSNLAAVFGAREIRFMQFGGDEGSAGVIDYGEIQADALSIHGRGTLATNRKVRIYDNAVVNGTVDAAGLITAPDVKVTNTTGSQPARLDSDKKVKGGKINVTSSSDIDTGTIPTGSIVIVSSGALAALGAFATGRILGTNDTTGLPEVKDVDLGNSAHVTVPGSHGDLLYNNGGANVAAITLADFIVILRSTLDSVYADKTAYDAHTHDVTLNTVDHSHGGGSIGPGTSDPAGSDSITATSTGPS